MKAITYKMITRISHCKSMACLLFTTVLVLAACDAGLTAEEHLQNAKAYYAEEKFNESAIELKNTLQADPNIAEARWLLGEIYLVQGAIEAATIELEKANELGFNSPKLKFSLLRSLLLQGEYMAVIRRGPNLNDEQANAELLALRGEAHLGLNELEHASAAFIKALELDPDLVAARFGNVRLSLRDGNYDKAQQQLNGIEELEPNNLQLWLLRGEMGIQTKNITEAESAYRQALDIAEQNTVARLGLARALLSQKRFDEVQEQIDIVIKQSPSSLAANFLLGLLEIERKNLQEAKDVFHKILSNTKSHPQSSLLLANIYYEEGQFEQAKNYITQFQLAFPNNLPALKLAAAIQLRLGKPADAIEILQPNINQASNDSQFFALLGSAYLDNGDIDKATVYLDRAAELAPGDEASIKTQLALGQLKGGHTEQAIAGLESAVELDPDLMQADILLVYIHLRRQEFAKALDMAKRSSEKHPENPIYSILMGTAYLGQKDIDSAIKQFNQALEIDPEFTPALINLANVHFKQGDSEAARQRFEEVLAINEFNVPALIGLAQIAGSDNQGKEVVRYLEKARQNNQYALAPRLMLGRYYLQTRDIEKARMIVNEALAITPERVAVLSLSGQIEGASGNITAAIESYRKIIAIQPDSVQAHYQLGHAQILANKPDEAKQSMERTLALLPDFLPGLSALSSLALRAGNYDEALTLASKIQEKYPDSPEGDALKGDILTSQGQIQDGIKAYDRAFAKQQTSTLAIKRHHARMQAGDRNTAIEGLNAWISENPQDVSAKLVLADSHLQEGNKDIAIGLYEESLEKEPNSIIALNNLAWFYYEAGDPRALNLAERAYQLNPDRIDIIDTLGWIFIEQDQVERGLTILQRAMLNEHVNATIRYHYAVGLAKSGDKEKAQTELETILASEEEFSERENAKNLLRSLLSKN